MRIQIDGQSVNCVFAFKILMRRGIGQWIDNRQLLDHRAGPSVRHDERQRIFMFRTDVNEMMSSPSISVMKSGRELSFASTLRQS
jgi:hypothetical protein